MYCLTSYDSPIGLLTLGSDGKHLTCGIRGCQEMAGPVFFRTKAVSG